MSGKRRKIEPPLHLDAAPGYAPDGASAHSHALARGRGNVVEFQDHAPEQPPRWRTLSELIQRNNHELRKIETKLSGELSRGARAKLQSDREIKLAFLSRLRAEYQAMVRKGANQ